MLDDKYFELKVGIFVSLGIIIFCFLAFSIGDINMVKKGYHIKTVFSYIDGVAKSAPVRYAGVTIGYVEKIRIFLDEGSQRSKVEITAFITDPERKIEKNAKATINTLGMLGEKYIEVFPGTLEEGVLADGDILVGKDPVMMSNITDALYELSESANVVVTRLKEGQGTVGKLLTEETIYNDLESFVADIKAHPWKLLNKPRGE